MSRSHFVEDLIPLILDSNDHWWDRDLVRLALVSPTWLHYVRKRLYAFPSLHSFVACSSLARTLESNPHLTSLIHRLALRPTFGNTSHHSPGRDRMAVRALLGLEGLWSLVIGGDLAVQSERFLGFVSASDTITELHIDGALLQESLGARASLEWTEDLIFRFPNLRRLRLTELELDINATYDNPSLNLEEVVLEGVTIIGGFLSHLIPGGSVLERLCVKTSSGCEYDEHIRSVLFSSDVHSLEYEVTEAASSDGSFLEPANPNPDGLHLHHLELHGLRVDEGMLASIGQRCPDIGELVISGRGICITAEGWKTYLASGALPSLRRLTVTWGTNHPPYKGWCATSVDPVARAASLRNVELLPFS